MSPLFLKSVVPGCSLKKVYLKVSQYLWENTCVGAAYSRKLFFAEKLLHRSLAGLNEICLSSRLLNLEMRYRVFFLSSGGNLTRSDFDHSGLFQS